jgi:DNA primase large subunit
VSINPYQIVDVDPILVSPRHLFRMPYSLNNKSGLVSVPVDPENISDFKKEDADPKIIKTGMGFLDKSEENEAEILISQAVDWNAKKERLRKKTERRIIIQKKVEQGNFPPCIQNILKGVADGRKRSIFILMNFLHSVKWDWDEIEKLMMEWNQKNTPPLTETYLRSQVRWHRRQNKTVLPANCATDGWYKDFGVCSPDQICKAGTNDIKLKNPVNYPFRKMRK